MNEVCEGCGLEREGVCGKVFENGEVGKVKGWLRVRDEDGEWCGLSEVVECERFWGEDGEISFVKVGEMEYERVRDVGRGFVWFEGIGENGEEVRVCIERENEVKEEIGFCGWGEVVNRVMMGSKRGEEVVRELEELKGFEGEVCERFKSEVCEVCKWGELKKNEVKRGEVWSSERCVVEVSECEGVGEVVRLRWGGMNVRVCEVCSVMSLGNSSECGGSGERCMGVKGCKVSGRERGVSVRISGKGVVNEWVGWGVSSS